MTDTTVSWEGVASGATPTTTTEPLLFAAPTPSSGGTIQGNPAAALVGGMGVELVAGTVGVCVYDTILDGATKQVIHCPIKLPATFPATATGNPTILQVYGGTGGTAVIARIRLRLNGSAWEVTFADLADAHGEQLVDANVASLAGTYIAIALQIDASSATANTNTAKVRVYTSPTSTTLHTTEFSATGQSLGSGLGMLRYRFGFASIQTVAGRTMMSDYQRQKGITGTMDATSWYGAVPAASAPVAVAGVDYALERNEVHQLTTAGSTIPAGTTILWSATHSEGAAVTLATPTTTTCNLSTAVAGLVTVTLTLTPLSGSPVTDTKLIYVRALAGEAWRARTVTLGTFSSVGGAATPLVAVSDSDDATFLRSTDTPAGQPLTATMHACGLGPIKLAPRNRANGGTISTLIETVYASPTDSTVIDTRTYTPPIGTFGATEWTLDSAAQTALTGGNDQASLMLRSQLVFESKPTA